MDEIERLTNAINLPLVEERDVRFAAAVRQRLVEARRWRALSGGISIGAGVVALALVVESGRRAAADALAPTLEVLATAGYIATAPLTLSIAACVFFVTMVVCSRH
jgi:hypothetical protein